MNNFLDQRKIGLIIGALVLAGVGIYFYEDSADQKDQASKSALYAVQKIHETEVASLPEPERAVGTPMNVDEKFAKSVEAYRKLLSEKKVSKRVLYESSIRLANLYLEHGQSDKAVEILKSVPDYSKTAFQKASGLYLLGVAQEKSGQFKAASDAFDAGLNQNVEGLKGELFLGMIRSSLKLNDKGKAKLYLEKMNKEVAGSHAAEMADELLNSATT